MHIKSVATGEVLEAVIESMTNKDFKAIKKARIGLISLTGASIRAMRFTNLD